MIVARVQTLVLMCLRPSPQPAAFPINFQSTQNAFHLYIHIVISDLVPAKFVAVNKMSKRIELANTGHIVRGHVVIITKLSPPFPVRDVALIPGLLPIFLHSCEIKSGRDLGTRLYEHHYFRV